MRVIILKGLDVPETVFISHFVSIAHVIAVAIFQNTDMNQPAVSIFINISI